MKRCVRNELDDYLTSLAQKDKSIMIVDPDIDSSLICLKFKKKHPENYINTGPREQLAMTVASAISKEGFKTIVGTFGSFIMRGIEPLKQCLVDKKLKLTVIGTHYGINVGEDGPSHQMMEDISVFRSFPRTTILSPGDCSQIREAIDFSLSNKGLTYIRLPRVDLMDLESPPSIFEPHIVIKGDSKYCIITYGPTIQSCKEAIEELKNKGISVTLIALPCISPINDSLMSKLKRFSHILTVEDGFISGNFGSCIADWIVDQRKKNKNFIPILHKHGLSEWKSSGSYAELYRQNKLDKEGIISTFLEIYS